jgi:hypothetical protein
MKFIWASACILCGLDMVAVAVGAHASAIVTPDYVWLAWLPAIGWFCGAYRAATARAA